MAIPLLVGAGAGLVAAALFASAATATALAGMLFYLAPLPICLAGLGWGSTAGAVAGLSGTVAVASVLGLAAGGIFGLAIGAPMAILCYLALLARAAAVTQNGPTGGLEWYPVGRLVGWCAIQGGSLCR